MLEHFGHTELRAGQEEIISRVLAGVNTLAILPTGGGKSLCYQLPALSMEGLAIVVSPLIALMRDQVEALHEKGVIAARLDSSTTESMHEDTLQKLATGVLKLLYLSPERLADPAVISLLSKQSVSVVAIDEAHCISEWGHSFRSSYIRLPKLVKKLKPKTILALTATAAESTARDIRKTFGILKRDQVQTSFYRANLSFDVSVVNTEQKKKRLLELLQQKNNLPSIVYATRRGDVEDLAAYLNTHGISARSYHAGMPISARAEVQDGFFRHKFSVICATIAFGMGVDMPDVRSVLHYHPPKSPEGWIQESGRAGRDGKQSHCEILICQEDRHLLETMIIARKPGGRAIESILQHLFSQGRQAIISHYNLSTLNDIPRELLDVMLARLEMGKWITPTGASWMWCHIVPLRWDSAARTRTLQGFSKKDQLVLGGLIDAKQRVSLLDLAEGRVSKLQKLITLLREAEAAGDVRLKLSHSLTHYQVLKTPEKIRDLADQVMEIFEQHASHELERIDAVFTMALSRTCLASSLVGYFGEKLDNPCGHCASCLGKSRPLRLADSDIPEVSLSEMAHIQGVVNEKHPALSSASRLARFLCGVYSPAMIRYHLYKKEQWALLSRIPYQDVLSICKVVL